jgi:hypothetical protein
VTRDEQAVVALLRSLYDWVPGPRTSTGAIVAKGALPGEVASAERDCPACDGKGRRRERGMEKACERCHGRGVLSVDAHTLREVAPEPSLEQAGALIDSIRAELSHESLAGPDPTTTVQTRLDRKRRQEGTIRRMEAARRVEAGEEATGDLLTAAIEQRDRYYEHGAYAELERCLSVLRRRDHGAYAAILAVHVLDQGLRTVGPRLAARAGEGVCRMADLMGKPIRVPPWVEEAEKRRAEQERRRSSEWYAKTARHEQARGPRNAEIRVRAANGEKPGHIARGLGMSKRRVEQIVASGMPNGLPVDEGVATFRL